VSRIRATVQGMVDFKHMDAESREFFLTLTECVKYYRSRHNMPNANMNGCTFALGNGKDAGKIRFGFMAIGDNIITLDIVIADLKARPEEYIDNMLEAIGQGLEQMQDKVSIIVPGNRSITSAKNHLSSSIARSIH
jgi:uncharacterized protein (DUF362 family)